jgi:hypothetical protein
MLSFSALPPDVLRHEIAPRLDATSLAQWRATERSLSMALRAPPASVEQWECAAVHVGHRRQPIRALKQVLLIRCLDQAIHDDHVARIDQLWPAFLKMASPYAKGARRYWRHIFYVCATCGSYGAWVYILLSFMSYTTSASYWSNQRREYKAGILGLTAPLWPSMERIVSVLRVSLPDFAAYVLGFGQLTFLMNACGLSRSNVFDWAIEDNPPPVSRYTPHSREPCITALMRYRHDDLVAALWTSRRPLYPFHNNVMNGALRFGFRQIVAQFSGAYDYAGFVSALFHGTSAEGFEVLAAQRPDLIQRFINDKKRDKKVNALKNQGKRSAAIYEWVKTL